MSGRPRFPLPIAKERIQFEQKDIDPVAGLEGFGAVPKTAEGLTHGIVRKFVQTTAERPDGIVDVAAPAPALDATRPRVIVRRKMPDVAPAAVPLAVPAAAQIPLGNAAQQELAKSKIEISPSEHGYIPTNRKGFSRFIVNSYKSYILAKPDEIPDPDACAKAIAESKKQFKTFKYQSFVRDYMQRASPYRGVLVYHGLGSGKTCTSIASMEALNQADPNKPVYIMTPASLSPNYRGDMTKCGPIVFRYENNWTWVPADGSAAMIQQKIGLPMEIIRKQRGAWIPDPTKPPNFSELGGAQQDQIKTQIELHMKAKFKFIHYNGLRASVVRDWVCNNPTMFDGATVVIDEVHNLIRTINGSDLTTMYRDEPSNAEINLATYIPKFCKSGRKYRTSYLLYRMLRQAVGCKIIALSATPIINFPQEVGILANLLAGDTRIATFEIQGINADRTAKLNELLKRHPEVDYYKAESGTSNTEIRITPVPSGYRKVIDEATGRLKGYVYHHALTANSAETIRERNIEAWFARVAESITRGVKGVMVLKPAYKAVARLPDTDDIFNNMYISNETFKIKEGKKQDIMSRLSGLISYYKGGRADLMARVTRDEVVELEMSDLQLKKYTTVRNEEIDRERSKSKQASSGSVTFDQVVKNVNSTFKIFSRAACNFVFPGEEVRPRPSEFRDAKSQAALEFGKVAEEIVDTSVEAAPAEAVPDVPPEDVEGDEQDAEEAPVSEETVRTYQQALIDAVQHLREMGPAVFSAENLSSHSPKFQAIINNMATSRGPVLVYSNFKTLEGVGLFSLALEIQLGYKKLDIVSTGGTWRLTPETLEGDPAAPRYIMYTGDEEREKRQVLLRIYNGQWDKLPKSLADEIRTFTGQSDNKAGNVAKVFMITQSGAEGISLANVRQVHIMEPYWNYVRLEQVKGRAVRICSHMDLPPEERTVDIFTYITKFGASQLVDDTLKTFDNKQTTDQMVMNLLIAKKTLADSLMDAMKESAVDCQLNTMENGVGACYAFPYEPQTEEGDKFLFDPLLE